MEHPKQILARYGLQAKKSLGQNFLHDDNILSDIVAAASVTPADHVLEIGAGLGALTRHLAQSTAQVIAFEIDQRFIPILRDQVGQRPNVTVMHGDILEHDPAQWYRDVPYKVVANIPYYVTGAILQHLLGADVKPQVMVLTVQQEVAHRITADPGDMTLLAVSVQLYGAVRIVRSISAGAFWPRPDVDSAVIRFELHPQSRLSTAQEKDFFRLVRVGFSQKRKQLQKNLRALGYTRDDTMSLLRAAGIDPRRRAETLSIEEWLRLHALIHP